MAQCSPFPAQQDGTEVAASLSLGAGPAADGWRTKMKRAEEGETRAGPAKRRRTSLPAAAPPLQGLAVCLALSGQAFQNQAPIWRCNLAKLGAAVIAGNDPDLAPPGTRRVVFATDDSDLARRAHVNTRGIPVDIVAPEWCEQSLRLTRACDTRTFPPPPPAANSAAAPAATRRGASAAEAAAATAGGEVEREREGRGHRGLHVWRSGTALPPVWAVRPAGDVMNGARRREVVAAMATSLLMHPRCNPELVPNPNADLVEQLRRVGKKRRLTNLDDGDKRFLSYARSAAFVSALPFKVVSADDVAAMPFVKDGIKAAVASFFTHGRILELDEFEKNEELAGVERLSQVFGISVPTAQRLSKAGVRTVEDALRHYEAGLSSPKAGVLASLRTCAQPVTYAEAAALVTRVADVARRAMPEHDLTFKLAGGFRRGCSRGHDVDILYCHAERRVTTSVLDQLVDVLTKGSVIVDTLGGQADRPGARELTFARKSSASPAFELAHDLSLTICRVPSADEPGGAGKAVRVDFVGVRQRDEWPFATLAWTGTTLFQRELRRWTAGAHDWVFNQHGLFDRTGKRVTPVPACATEHDIFNFLGLPYLSPYERCL
jgi:DNA polymerase/3'-5' exonuclease PolX